MDAPICPYCCKAIRRYTGTVYAPTLPGSLVPQEGWSYSGNFEVVGRRYAQIDPVDRSFILEDERDPDRLARAERHLRAVFVWDGETYQFSYGYFCSNVCAGRYGRMAWEAVREHHGVPLKEDHDG